MFDNSGFEQWLDENAQKAMQKVTNNEALKSEEIIVLVLKAQTNHITHLEQDLRGEILTLRKDMNDRFEQVDKRFEQVQEQMNRRFEQVDKRFEQVDKRFECAQEQMNMRFKQAQEQVDKRFESVQAQINNFMRWSLTAMISCSGVIIAAVVAINQFFAS